MQEQSAKQTPLFALFKANTYASKCGAYSSTRPTLTNATTSQTAGFLLHSDTHPKWMQCATYVWDLHPKLKRAKRLITFSNRKF